MEGIREREGRIMKLYLDPRHEGGYMTRKKEEGR